MGGVGSATAPQLSVISSVSDCMFCHETVKRPLQMPLYASTHPTKIWNSFQENASVDYFTPLSVNLQLYQFLKVNFCLSHPCPPQKSIAVGMLKV